MISHLDLILRIASGAALGGVIGFERDIHKRPIGLRTHFIVALAAATFMVVSNQFIFFQDYSGTQHAEVDVSRIAASVVSAIGFLAGGSILKSGGSVQGITTAAGLWLVTAIGLAAGGGMYFEAIIVTALGLVALTVMRLFEDKKDQPLHRRIELVMKDDKEKVQFVSRRLEELHVKTARFDYEKKRTEKLVMLKFDISVPVKLGVAAIIEELEKLDEVMEIHVKAVE